MIANVAAGVKCRFVTVNIADDVKCRFVTVNIAVGVKCRFVTVNIAASVKCRFVTVKDFSAFHHSADFTVYGRTSMVRTPMARLPRLFRTRS